MAMATVPHSAVSMAGSLAATWQSPIVSGGSSIPAVVAPPGRAALCACEASQKAEMCFKKSLFKTNIFSNLDHMHHSHFTSHFRPIFSKKMYGNSVKARVRFRHRTAKVSASFGEELLHNEALATATAAMLSAQLLKPFTAALSGQGFNLKLVIKSGGMPSSHSAVVTSLATALCLERGASDPIFGAFVVYACIVMYDAQGVRRAVGKQAEVLNTLVVPQLAEPSPLKSLQSEAAAVVPPTAIGVELGNPQKVDLQFYESGSSELDKKTEREIGASIGVELANAPAQLELAFVESREGGGKASNSTSNGLSGGPLQNALGRRSEGEGSGEGGGGGGSGREGRQSPWERRDRSKEFWQAAASEPSMRGGEVVPQELGKVEGWRHIPLKESVGHTKLEVIVGALAGILLSMGLHALGWYSSSV